MKKTITKIVCGECGKEIVERGFTFNICHSNGSIMDLCWECIKSRVLHSYSIVPDSKCPTCKGKGKVKESCGYHNDYEWNTCNACAGKGKSI